VKRIIYTKTNMVEFIIIFIISTVFSFLFFNNILLRSEKLKLEEQLLRADIEKTQLKIEINTVKLEFNSYKQKTYKYSIDLLTKIKDGKLITLEDLLEFDPSK